MIRIATPDDAGAIGAVRTETWLATYPNAAAGITADDIRDAVRETPEHTARRRASLAETEGPWRTWVAATAGGEVVGFCVARREESSGRVQAVYVLPGHQREGIGAKLMEQAMQWLVEREVRVNVASYNETAIRFYRRHGFAESGRPADSGIVLLSGKTIPEIEMIRPAAPAMRD